MSCNKVSSIWRKAPLAGKDGSKVENWDKRARTSVVDGEVTVPFNVLEGADIYNTLSSKIVNWGNKIKWLFYSLYTTERNCNSSKCIGHSNGLIHLNRVQKFGDSRCHNCHVDDMSMRDYASMHWPQTQWPRNGHLANLSCHIQMNCQVELLFECWCSIDNCVRSGSPTTVVNACGGVALRHNSVVALPVAHISFPLLLYHLLPFCECISPLSFVFTTSV